MFIFSSLFHQMGNLILTILQLVLKLIFNIPLTNIKCFIMFSEFFKFRDFLIDLDFLPLHYKFEYTIFALEFFYMRLKIYIFLLQILFYLLQFFKISNKFLVNAVFNLNIFEDTFHLLVFIN